MLPLLLLLAPPAGASLLPAELFDLSRWKLQLPERGEQGFAASVSAKKLQSYNSSFFHVAEAGKSLRFWCPVSGAKTKGSVFPRTELRDTTDWFAYDPALHELNVSAVVRQAPPSGRLVVGQVHSNAFVGNCSVVLMLEWVRRGPNTARLEARLRDELCREVTVNLGYRMRLNVPFDYSVAVQGGLLSVSTSWEQRRKRLQNYKLTQPFAQQPIFFKVGAYVQDTGLMESEGALVEVRQLAVSHGMREPFV